MNYHLLNCEIARTKMNPSTKNTQNLTTVKKCYQAPVICVTVLRPEEQLLACLKYAPGGGGMVCFGGSRSQNLS